MVGKTLVKQSKLMKNGALASVLFLFSSFISAQTYYVDASKGNDNNSGTSILVPWQSLDKVSNQQFYPGDNILFKAGEQWTGSLTLSSSGAKDLPITYGSYGDLQNFGKPYINGNGKLYNHTGEAKNESIIIFAKNKEFIHLENLKVSADSFDVTGIKSTTGIYFGSDIKRQLSGFKLTNVTVQDVFQSKIDDPKRFNKKGKRIRVSKGKSFAVRFQSKYPTDRNARFNNILVENSTITNNQREGLRFIGADNIVIRNNTFYKNGGSAAVVNNYYDLTFENNDCQYSGAGESTGDDIRMHNRGSSLWTVFGEKALVRNNTFKHSRGWLDSYGMHVDHNNKDVIVEKNYFEDNEGGFIQIIGDNQNITYRYNVSVNDGLDLNQNNRTASTIHFSDYVGQDKKTGKKKPGIDSTGIKIYNNTVYISADAQNISADIELRKSEAYIANNIFYVAPKQSKKMSLRNSNEMKSVLANNLFYGNVSDELKALDTNLVVNDPQFVNIKDDHFENAFRLSRTSPALNSGVIIKEDVGSDFWGNAASSKVIPNIGAFNGQF